MIAPPVRRGGLGLALATLVLGACGGASPQVKAARAQAIVLVQSNVRDAQLFVDGRFITTLDAARGGIALSPGAHRFELRRDDFFSSYLELQLGTAERKKVSMAMAPVLP